MGFDNYDEMTETLDGYSTLHDTVCIAYQNITVIGRNVNSDCDHEQNNSTNATNENVSDIRHRKLKKKRTLEIGERDIKPFTCGKLKIKNYKFHLTETVEPDNLLQCKRRDIAWMVSCASIDTIPMWHGIVTFFS